MPAKPYPARNLIEYLNCDSLHLTSELLGLGAGTAHRWVNNGRHFTEVEADALAIKIGVHPSEIWPNWWSEVELVSAASGRRHRAR